VQALAENIIRREWERFGTPCGPNLARNLGGSVLVEVWPNGSALDPGRRPRQARAMSDPSGVATFRTPAEAYDRHIGRYGRELARALIRAAGVQPGQRALDVGCGPGALASELAALLGAEQVAAVDPSDPFAEACRRRQPGVSVEVAAAEALPFEDGLFDHALSQLVINFMTDPAAGVREMSRVTRAGGTVSAAVWDYAAEMTLLRRFWDAAVTLDPSAADLDEGRIMPFCTPEELGGLWSAAGLADVHVRSVNVSADYEGFEDLWQPLELGVGPSGAYAKSLSSERRTAFKQELRRRLDVGDEPFRLTARAWVATGQRTAATD
jgi:SAM-dependent methyltransferase